MQSISSFPKASWCMIIILLYHFQRVPIGCEEVIWESILPPLKSWRYCTVHGMHPRIEKLSREILIFLLMFLVSEILPPQIGEAVVMFVLDAIDACIVSSWKCLVAEGFMGWCCLKVTFDCRFCWKGTDALLVVEGRGFSSRNADRHHHLPQKGDRLFCWFGSMHFFRIRRRLFVGFRKHDSWR